MATILVVDDEMGIRELLSEILSDEGHAVEVAENAQQARDYRLRQTPDLVLLDIWMPDTDGVTLLKEWAAQGQLTMPVIMMSGHATIDTAVEATRIGALNFLEKPIALQKLLKAVEQGLARAGQPHTPVNHSAAVNLGPVLASGAASVVAVPLDGALPGRCRPRALARAFTARANAPRSRSTFPCAMRATPSSVPTSNTTWRAKTAA
jgi:DNA-binding response OmpR family regulator